MLKAGAACAALLAALVVVFLVTAAGAAHAAIDAPRYVWYCFVSLDPFEHAFWQCGWYPVR